MTQLHGNVLDIDCAAEADRIAARMIEIVGVEQHRRGGVIAVSGGVDSSVCAALAVRAFGAAKVFALMLPEHDSSPDSLRRAKMVVEQLGIPVEHVRTGHYSNAVQHELAALLDSGRFEYPEAARDNRRNRMPLLER